MSTRGRAPNPSGVHFLVSSRIAAGLVSSSGVGPGDLVIDLGAGRGAVTAPLAATGARVLAVERDPHFARSLRCRFADRPAVRVVHGDVLTVPLPRREFVAVASIPFAVSSELLGRLLDRRSALTGADLIVEWGFARRLTTALPTSLRAAWWTARYQPRIRRRVPSSCFAPSPRVDAAHLVVRRTPLTPAAELTLWMLLRAVHSAPARPARAVLADRTGRRAAHRVLIDAGVDPTTPAGAVPPQLWTTVATRI